MSARHPATEIQKYMNELYDKTRAVLWKEGVNPGAAEDVRRELAVILEVVRDEVVKLVKSGELEEGYEPGAILEVLEIPGQHRVWRRLDAVQGDAREHSEALFLRVTGGQILRALRCA